jgi:hypothetical protein
MELDKRFYVYQLRRSDSSEPFYVGKGSGIRAWQHFIEIRTANAFKARTIKKAQREGVEVLVEFIADNLSNDDALRYEVWAIKMWGRRDFKEGPLTNLTDGGDGGKTISNPIVRAKWEEAVRRGNAKPGVSEKRSKSAKGIWDRPNFREEQRIERKARYDDPEQVKKKIFQGWSKSAQRWFLAPEIYDVWNTQPTMSYKVLANLMVQRGHKFMNLQRMVNFFRKEGDPRTSKIYQEWLDKYQQHNNKE